MRAIHQFIAGYSRGDAISNEAVVMRDIFRSWGYSSEIFSESKRILPELRREAADVSVCAASLQPDDMVILHLSIGSVVNEVFASLRCRKVILYHNITPPIFFRGIQEEIARHLARGREQLAKLVGVADLVMADSQYNADEMMALGYGEVSVLPLVLDLDKIRHRPDRACLKEYDDGNVNVLFVGRCVPNKRIEDLIQAFHFFQTTVEPASRLILAGSYSGMEAYQAYQLALTRELKVKDVEFTGSIRQDTLNACYQSADVFLCMSEHEGFCIPVIEAMAADVPVLAYAAAAVPGTMDGAGVLFHEKQFDHVAEMMGRLCADVPFRDAVLAGQRERIARYEGRNLRTELKERLTPLLG